jgi:hypothetical protein
VGTEAREANGHPQPQHEQEQEEELQERIDRHWAASPVPVQQSGLHSSAARWIADQNARLRIEKKGGKIVGGEGAFRIIKAHALVCIYSVVCSFN